MHSIYELRSGAVHRGVLHGALTGHKMSHSLMLCTQLLLLMLTITFFLLAAGEKHHTVQKAS